MTVQSARRVAMVLSLATLCVLSGCVLGTRKKVPVEEMRERRVAFTREIEAEKHNMFDTVQNRLARIVDEAKGGGERPVFDILLLSGGGDYGAFGAGLLVGWGAISDPDMARPEFDFVTGVSTGALIAPYAFIGTEESLNTVLHMYENPKRDWLKTRTLLNIITHQRSIYNVDGLHKEIRRTVTQEMADEIAQGIAVDRILMAGATSLDYGVFKPFNLGGDFAVSANTKDLSRPVDIMLASSAIPGGFPPILIDDDLFVDGGATVQMWLPEERNSFYDEVHWLREKFGDEHPRIRIWAIVNNKLTEPPQIVQPRLGAIIGRSLGISIRASVLQTLRDVETVALLLKARGIDVEFRFVAIPEEFKDDPGAKFFDKDTMTRLGELGRKMGADISSWRTRVPAVEWPDELFSELAITPDVGSTLDNPDK